MILLKEKQKKSSLNANEQLRLKLLIERVDSKLLRSRTQKEESYYISSKMIKDLAGDMEEYGEHLVMVNGDAEESSESYTDSGLEESSDSETDSGLHDS